MLITALISGLLFSQNAHAIVGGKPVSVNDPITRSTVSLKISQGKEFALCTGTLIGPKTILTAAHCVCDSQSTAVNPRQVVVQFGLQAFHPDYSVGITEILFAPGQTYDLWNPDTDDIAILHLEHEAPRGYIPVPLLKHQDLSNQSLIIAGYGETEETKEDNQLHSAEVKTLKNTYPWNSILLATDHGRGTCFGDSGGPAYLKVGDQLYVAGVTSSPVSADVPMDQVCHLKTIDTNATLFRNWISKNTF